MEHTFHYNTVTTKKALLSSCSLSAMSMRPVQYRLSLKLLKKKKTTEVAIMTLGKTSYYTLLVCQVMDHHHELSKNTAGFFFLLR